MSTKDADVLIIGGGIAGLTCAHYLHKGGKKVKVLEASDRIGGRVKTDRYKGFLLDHGFQVLLTAYPEAKKLLDYKKLDLKEFGSGSLIYTDRGDYKLPDPSRTPGTMFSMIFSGVGTLRDKILLFRLKNRLKRDSLEKIFSRPEKTTMEYLQDKGFSHKFIQRFFKPFFSGIFLEHRLKTSSRMFEFVFKMFSEGSAAIPAEGMEAIPRQIGDSLPEGSIICEAPVESYEEGKVVCKDGKEYTADQIVVAADTPELLPNSKRQPPADVTCLYFESNQPLYEEPLIALYSKSGQLTNNIAILDNVQETYSNSDSSLISVTVKYRRNYSIREIQQRVKDELIDNFPVTTLQLSHVKNYHIEYALPNQRSVRNEVKPGEYELSKNIYRAGDYLLNGSLNAAMKTGREVAELILNPSTIEVKPESEKV